MEGWIPDYVLLSAHVWLPTVIMAVLAVGWVLTSTARTRAQVDRIKQEIHKERERNALTLRELEAERARPVGDGGRQLLEDTAHAFRELFAAADPQELGEVLGRNVAKVLDPAQWMVFRADPAAEGEYVLVAGGGRDDPAPWPEGARLNQQMGRLGLAARRRTLMDRDDFAAEPSIVTGQLASTEPGGFDVEVAAPVVVGDDVVFLVAVGGPKPQLECTRHALELLRSCAAAMMRQLDARERAQRWANKDELTGLFNKGYFNAQASELVYQKRASGEPAALILFGVDDFRGYVDRNGHTMGDRLLKHLAEALRPLFRQGDLMARWAADEFVALLPGVGSETAFAIAERLRTTVGDFNWPGCRQQPRGRLTICAGVAAAPEDGENYDQLVDVANRSLVAARWGGGDQVGIRADEPASESDVTSPAT